MQKKSTNVKTNKRYYTNSPNNNNNSNANTSSSSCKYSSK